MSDPQDGKTLTGIGVVPPPDTNGAGEAGTASEPAAHSAATPPSAIPTPQPTPHHGGEAPAQYPPQVPPPYPQPGSQPYPPQSSQPYLQPGSQPYPPQSALPYPQPVHETAPDAVSPTHAATPPRPHQPTEAIETLSGHFLGISLRRAFRLQIRTDEVLASERRALEATAKHITDPEHQAFLAWRRSVLLLVAIVFVPLTILRFYEGFVGPKIPATARMFVLMPAVAEAIFCAIAFDQLKNWTLWEKQRRVIFIAWAIYFFAPFLVYLYPFRDAFEDSMRLARAVSTIGGVKLSTSKTTVHLVVGLSFGMRALLVLGPKVISLMPGLIRASIVSKLLFPGTTAPGWLMILAAPVYALLAYIIVLLPYQITGSWHFVVGNAGILFAQVFIAYSGRRLTIPLTTAESHHRIHRAWIAYIGIMLISAGFMLIGLYDFITQIHLEFVRIISGVLSFIGNVLVLTLIGTDAIVAGMAHFRRRVQPEPQREALLRESEAKLDRFCR